MYTDLVTDIIDELIFDEEYNKLEDARTEGIRRLLQENLKVASNGFHSSYSPNVRMAAFEQIRKYFDPDVDEYNVLGFYDDTLFGNGHEGIVFGKDGMFIREMWSSPYYVSYAEIISRETIATKKEMTLCLEGGEKQTENMQR